MALELRQIEGATPLSPDDLNGLRLASVVTQADLNAAEEANVLAATVWSRRTRRSDLLSRDYILTLHRKMFGDVWSWAGTWRQRETNIGVTPNVILVRVEALVRDVEYWIESDVYPANEIAVRLHHQLVLVHPFANGNGRHARLMADLLAVRLKGLPFSWGRHDLSEASVTRRAYIQALQTADRGDITPLLEFARS